MLWFIIIVVTLVLAGAHWRTSTSLIGNAFNSLGTVICQLPVWLGRLMMEADQSGLDKNNGGFIFASLVMLGISGGVLFLRRRAARAAIERQINADAAYLSEVQRRML